MAGARTNRIMTLTALASLGALGMGLGGCAGYSSYPHADGSLTRSSTSTRAATGVMRESLRWTTSRTSGVPERYAINLPAGVEPQTYASIASSVGGEALSSSNTDLPRYSVTRVWVRSGQAKVDVVRPVLALGKNSDGAYPTQGITIELEGGLEPWRVVRYRPWAIGTLANAPENFIDAYIAPDAGYAGDEPGDDGAWREAIGDDTTASSTRSAEFDAEDSQFQTEPRWVIDDEPVQSERTEASVPTNQPDVIEINP